MRTWAMSALGFCVALLAADSAMAFEGRYVAGTKDYRQELTIKKRPDGRYTVTGVVGTEGCSGLISDAVGAAAGDTLRAEAKEDDQTCVLVIRRTRKGVHVEEQSGGCLDFHGPSCEVSGDYRRRR